LKEESIYHNSDAPSELTVSEDDSVEIPDAKLMLNEQTSELFGLVEALHVKIELVSRALSNERKRNNFLQELLRKKDK